MAIPAAPGSSLGGATKFGADFGMASCAGLVLRPRAPWMTSKLACTGSSELSAIVSFLSVLGERMDKGSSLWPSHELDGHGVAERRVFAALQHQGQQLCQPSHER